jgi:hypothetical protein
MYMYNLVSKVFAEKLLPLSKSCQAMHIVNNHYKNLPLILHKVSGLIHVIVRLGIEAYKICMYSNEMFIQMSSCFKQLITIFYLPCTILWRTLYPKPTIFYEVYVRWLAWPHHAVNIMLMLISLHNTSQTGALSCWNIDESLGKWRSITGHSWLSSISIYCTAFIYSSSLHKVPEPCQVIYLVL